MSAPRRPPGPPPRPLLSTTTDGTIQGINANVSTARRPVGPPPPTAIMPVMQMKPPPMQPPPTTSQSDRPTVQNIRAIQPKVVAPFSMPPRFNPPPRAVASILSTAPTAGDMKMEGNALTPSKRTDEYMLPGMKNTRVAPPKNIESSQGKWSKKPGAMPMFNSRRPSGELVAPAESKAITFTSDVPASSRGNKEAIPVTTADIVTEPSPLEKEPPLEAIHADKLPSSVAVPVQEVQKPPVALSDRPAPDHPPSVADRDTPVAASNRRPRDIVPPQDEAPFKRPVKKDILQQQQLVAKAQYVVEKAESSDDDDDQKKGNTQLSPEPRVAENNAANDVTSTVKEGVWVAQTPLKRRSSTTNLSPLLTGQDGTQQAQGQTQMKEQVREAMFKQEDDKVDEPHLRPDVASELDQHDAYAGVPNKGEIAASIDSLSEKPVSVEESFLSLPAGDTKPPPAATTTHNVDRANLKCGRLSVRLVEGVNISLMGSKTSVDPFIKLRLGANETFEWKRSAVLRKSNENPNFNNEVICFEVFNPLDHVMQDDIQLVGEVWSSGMFEDKLFATFNISVLRILSAPFLTFNEKLELSSPSLPEGRSKLYVDIFFEEARTGMFVMTLFEARGLRNVDPLGHQRPYISLTLGKTNHKRSKFIDDSPTEPYFAEEEIFLWSDKDNWSDDLQIDILDEDIGKGKPIASVTKGLLGYMNYSLPLKDGAVETLSVGGSGELVFKLRFYPGGVIEMKCNAAKNLQYPDNYISPAGANKIDPYVVFKMNGLSNSFAKRTPAEKDGGPNPIFNYDIIFDIVDQYTMDIEVYHQNVVGADILLGYAELSLLPVFKKGETNTWITLRQKKQSGGIAERGDLNLVLKFSGPPGLAFPQCRPEVDGFDDSTRKGAILSSTALNDAILGTQSADYKPEFSDEEIRAAFNFIDLDHNNFVGAAEIRHILVCMGELITDEEIDMMISMVDLDGDGQVGYSEFKFLVLHPNPGEADLVKEMAAQKIQEQHQAEKELSLVLKAKGGQTDVSSGIDIATHHRQKELFQKEMKRKSLMSFVTDNDMDFEDVRIAYTKYIPIAKQKNLTNGTCTFDIFIEIFKVDPISEYKKLFELFDDESLQKIDIKEFMLSLLNFISNVERDDRIKFAFELYDERRTNFISILEVEYILRGNHMVSLTSVVKKAETIMKQATTNAQGLITLTEFQSISKKFPNILFPVFQNDVNKAATIKFPVAPNNTGTVNSNKSPVKVPLLAL